MILIYRGHPTNDHVKVGSSKPLIKWNSNEKPLLLQPPTRAVALFLLSSGPSLTSNPDVNHHLSSFPDVFSVISVIFRHQNVIIVRSRHHLTSSSSPTSCQDVLASIVSIIMQNQHSRSLRL
jgi:hypothetical protein